MLSLTFRLAHQICDLWGQKGKNPVSLKTLLLPHVCLFFQHCF